MDPNEDTLDKTILLMLSDVFDDSMFWMSKPWGDGTFYLVSISI